MGETVLREVSNRQRRRLQHAAGVGLVESRHHPQQGGFAGAVGAAQPGALTVGDLPRDVVQKNAVAERFGKFLELDHSGAGCLANP